MKTRNNMMRIASALLILTLVSTCAVSTSFAKYVSKTSTSQSAQVAKWGINLSMDGNLFGEQYAANSSSYKNLSNSIVATSTNSLSTTAATSNEQLIVAPGTKGNTLTIHLGGTAEVEYDVEVNIPIDLKEIYVAPNVTFAAMEPVTLEAGASLTGYYIKDGTTSTYTAATEDATAEDGVTYYKVTEYGSYTASARSNYYPMTWTLTDGNDNAYAVVLETETGEDSTVTTVETLMVASEVDDDDTEVTPIRLSDVAEALKNALTTKLFRETGAVDMTYTLTWEWAYESTYSTGNKAAYDTADTLLGSLINAATAGCDIVVKNDDGTYTTAKSGMDSDAVYCLDVSFGITITVTQKD